MAKETLPEPWLRGPIAGVSPLLAPVLYSFQQAREDLGRWTEGLSPEQIWASPHGATAVGFHLKHIPGSVERLMTYALGKELSAEQLAAMKAEEEPGGTREELLAHLGDVFRRTEESIRALDPATLAEPRAVGRKRLPTTLVGLLVHMAEHTQRHVGEAIASAKLARGV